MSKNKLVRTFIILTWVVAALVLQSKTDKAPEGRIEIKDTPDIRMISN